MKKFLFNGYALYQGKIFYKDYESGLLCELDTNTGICNYIENIKNYKIDKISYDCMIEFKNKLYAIENNGKSMLIYDGLQNTCSCVNMNCGTRPWGNFMDLIGYENTLFLFHREENWVTCFDTISGVIEKVETGDKNGNICCCRRENKVWMFPKEGNRVQEFDLETRLCTEHVLDKDIEGVMACASDEKCIYLLQDSGLIYVVNMENITIQDNTVAMISSSVDKRMGRIICLANDLILFPISGEDIKCVNLSEECVNVYSNYPMDFVYDDIAWSKYYMICEDDTYYYLLRKSNYLLKIDKKDGRFIWVKLIIGNESVKDKLEFKYAKEIVVEGRMGINTLIETLDSENQNAKFRVGSCGKEVWRNI